MQTTYRRGFTLVELLVVIVVISILMAMAVPALIGARETARQTQCMKNQTEIANAVNLYVAAKGHYPGYVNPPGHSWPVVLLPHLGENGLWKQWRVKADPGARGIGQVDILKCPDDSRDEGGGKAMLSYVANRNIFLDRVGSPNQNLAPSDVDTLTQTIMISERMKNTGPWTTTNLQSLTFPPPDASTTSWPNRTAAVMADYLGSAHPDLLIVTFLDGSSKKVPLSAPCKNYQLGPKTWLDD